MGKKYRGHPSSHGAHILHIPGSIREGLRVPEAVAAREGSKNPTLPFMIRFTEKQQPLLNVETR